MNPEYNKIDKEDIIDAGKRVIFQNPDLVKSWENYVNKNFSKENFKDILINALDVMIALNNDHHGNNIESATEILEKRGLNYKEFEQVRNIVLNFSPKGVEFYKHTQIGNPTDKEIEIVEKISKRNNKYNNNLELDLKEKGYKAIHYDQDIQDDWDRFVEESLKADKTGTNCKNVLKVCNQLKDRESLEFSDVILGNLNLDEASLNKLRKQVAYFSILGPEFYLATSKKPLTSKEIKYLNDIYARNVELNNKYIDEYKVNPKNLYSIKYTTKLEELLELNNKDTKDSPTR